MSRLYETLKRIEDGRPGSILPVVEAGAAAPAPPVVVLPERTPAAAPTQQPGPVVPSGTPRPEPHEYGRIERLRLEAGSPVFPFDGSDVRAAEQYRMLRTNLLQHEMQPHVIAVTSGDSGDGKTVTAVNIAGALALSTPGKVLLIDADMRHGSLAPLLGISSSPGLAEVLRRTCAMDNAVRRLEQAPNLYVLPSGESPLNPAELLDSSDWKALLRTAREQFRFTIIDTTPVAAVADFDLVQSAADGVLLVVRPEHTKRGMLDHALTVIPKSKMLGVVVNCVKDWLLWKRYGRSYYYRSPRPAAAAAGDQA